MSKAWQRAINIGIMVLLTFVLLAAVVLFTALYRYDQKRQTGDVLYPVMIEGEYSEEGGPWKPLTRETEFENWELRDITVRGHFNRDLPEGIKLFLNLDHMRVSLRINGEEIFRLEPVAGDGNPTRAMGKQWVPVVSPGITTADTVEMNFGNLYWNAYMIQFDELLWQMHAGDERMMLFAAVREEGWIMGIGVVFLFMTLFLMIIAVCCAALRLRGALRFLWLSLATLFSSLWFLTLSPALTLILPWPVFLNVLYAFSMQGMIMFLILFVLSNLSGWRRQLLIAGEGVLLLALLAGLVCQMLSIQDLYSAINYFSVFDVIIAVCMVFCLWYEAYRMKKEESAALLKASLFLTVCGVVELINGYIQFSKAAILLGAGLISFTIAECVVMLRRVKRSMENEKRALMLENELNHNRIAIMTSQIQPHFLYNALLGIKQLCDTNPEKASEALEHFSYYLRGNLDSLAQAKLISFEKEWEHLRDYLYLEQMRFEEKLRVEWKLSFTDFMIPPLTVQPIAENAVRYGITKKRGGGTLTIGSERTETAVVITVSDDGAGFDTTEKKQDGRSHTGIENVRSRLQAQCGGMLEIESEAGRGTTVKIILPFEREEP